MEQIFTVAQRMQIKNQVEKILHVPGNYRGGNLEFAIIFDYDISKEILVKSAGELVAFLKQTDKIFINARLNTIKWVNDSTIVKEVSAMGLVQMGRVFSDYDKYSGIVSKSRKFDILSAQLKKFYARSKLIIHLTNEQYIISDEKEVFTNMHPFLIKKYMKVNL